MDSRQGVISDHNYDKSDEPPAFIIRQVNLQPTESTVHLPIQSVMTQTLVSPSGMDPYVKIAPKLMTISPGYGPSVNVIQVTDNRQQSQELNTSFQSQEVNMNKRIRRSEELLRQAADSVSRGLTFQTVSERFNIPISTIRFYMARKGILPRRRRGRHGQSIRPCTSPEPPFHMQHFKLPDMAALKADYDDEGTN